MLTLYTFTTYSTIELIKKLDLIYRKSLYFQNDEYNCYCIWNIIFIDPLMQLNDSQKTN
jgi:hypothetical protein